MTIVSVKDRLENIINLPQSMPSEFIGILVQDVVERSWEDVENLQRAAWNMPDSINRGIIDKVVENAYQARYGKEAAKQDASGRIINSSKEWRPKKGIDSDKIVQIGLKLRSLSAIETEENIFRGIEHGLNILRGANVKPIKICGNFDDAAENLFNTVLRKNSVSDILEAFKKGLITDCVLSYQNKDLSGEEKKRKAMQIINVFDEPDDFNVETDKTKEEENFPEDIKGFIWEAEDGCEECKGYNGKFFSVDDLPVQHPNCRCAVEVVFDDMPIEKQKNELNEKIYKRNLKDLERFEGKKDFIYLDTEGNMTTGMGTNVDERAVFQKVEFRDESGRLLTAQEKDVLYDQIQKDKKTIPEYKKKTADYYKDRWNAKIDEKETQRLIKEHVEADLNALRKMCKTYGKDFDRLPPSQQDALLDMHYNMGSINPKKWPDFYEAFGNDDYDLVAEESHRKKPISEDRNDWTRDKFKAAKIEAQKMR